MKSLLATLLVAALLLPGPVSAEGMFRMQLSSPLLMGSPGGGPEDPGETTDPGDEEPPPGGGNSENPPPGGDLEDPGNGEDPPPGGGNSEDPAPIVVTPVHVGTGSGVTVLSSGSPDFMVHRDVQEGDLLLMWEAKTNNVGSLPDLPPGWQVVESDGNMRLSYTFAVAGDNSLRKRQVSVSTTSKYAGIISAFRGVDRAQPFVSTLISNNRSGYYSPDMGPLPVIQGGTVLSFGASGGSGSGGVTWPEDQRSVSEAQSLYAAFADAGANSVNIVAAMGGVPDGVDVIETPVLRYRNVIRDVSRRVSVLVSLRPATVTP
jgi:hypothetical protein